MAAAEDRFRRRCVRALGVGGDEFAAAVLELLEASRPSSNDGEASAKRLGERDLAGARRALGALAGRRGGAGGGGT